MKIRVIEVKSPQWSGDRDGVRHWKAKTRLGRDVVPISVQPRRNMQVTHNVLVTERENFGAWPSKIIGTEVMVTYLAHHTAPKELKISSEFLHFAHQDGYDFWYRLVKKQMERD